MTFRRPILLSLDPGDLRGRVNVLYAPDPAARRYGTIGELYRDPGMSEVAFSPSEDCPPALDADSVAGSQSWRSALGMIRSALYRAADEEASK